MAFGRKRNTNAVDRAVDDIERQITALQQQMRTLDGDGRVGRAVSRAESMKKFDPDPTWQKVRATGN